MVSWGIFGRKALQFIATPIRNDARINILHGSVRSGKTVAMIPKWLDYINHGPSGLLAMTGVSKQTIKRNVLNDLFDTVGRSNYSYNNQTGELRIYRRNLQVIGIKDEGSEKYLRGPTFAGAYSDEATTMPESSFKQLLNRLSVDGAKFYGTTNPDSPYHYLYTDYITDSEKIASGMVQSIHFELDDNPSLSEEYKTFIRSAYSGLWYKRMILGLWVQAEGAIYDMFDDSRHTISYLELPDNFREVLVGVDYGAGNPTVFLKIGVTMRFDGTRDFWVYDEYYHDPRKSGAKTAAQYKADMIRFIGDDNVLAIYPDPSALSFITELESDSCGRRYNNVARVDNSVLEGINTVATNLTQDRIHYVREKCPNTLKEVVSYIWDEKAQKLGEDKPLKTNDHCMDAERYPLHTQYPAVPKEMVFF